MIKIFTIFIFPVGFGILYCKYRRYRKLRYSQAIALAKHGYDVSIFYLRSTPENFRIWLKWINL